MNIACNIYIISSISSQHASKTKLCSKSHRTPFYITTSINLPMDAIILNQTIKELGLGHILSWMKRRIPRVYFFIYWLSLS